ncbi:hypothetical protein [Streptomyces sp. NPDC059072]|uniref:hypothetical protein n=1 Tax=Streptomyces sp. NPDC059072 TaxID=3346715 RepID=UPI0036BC3DBB
MADETGPKCEATLYEATHFTGAAVAVWSDRGDEGGEAVAFSLARLGLNRLGSLRARASAAEPGAPFRQELSWVTTVTVWESEPRSWTPHDGERGRTWQEYDADTADLGTWATRATFVRVRKHRTDRPALTDDPAVPIAAVG